MLPRPQTHIIVSVKSFDGEAISVTRKSIAVANENELETFVDDLENSLEFCQLCHLETTIQFILSSPN